MQTRDNWISWEGISSENSLSLRARGSVISEETSGQGAYRETNEAGDRRRSPLISIKVENQKEHCAAVLWRRRARLPCLLAMLAAPPSCSYLDWKDLAHWLSPGWRSNAEALQMAHMVWPHWKGAGFISLRYRSAYASLFSNVRMEEISEWKT